MTGHTAPRPAAAGGNAHSNRATSALAKLLEIDPQAETEKICTTVRRQILQQLRRRGAVVALSGGIDSSVTAALCARGRSAPRRCLQF